MSESGSLRPLEFITDPAARRNFEAVERQHIGRGPAQARVFHDANQSITTSGTAQALVFNSERFDTGNFHDAAANSRLTAPTAGLYLIGGSVFWAASATGVRQLFITIDGVIIAREVMVASASTTHGQSISSAWQMDAGDVAELVVVQSSGGALNVTTNASYSPEFWIVRLGSQA